MWHGRRVSGGGRDRRWIYCGSFFIYSTTCVSSDGRLRNLNGVLGSKVHGPAVGPSDILGGCAAGLPRYSPAPSGALGQDAATRVGRARGKPAAVLASPAEDTAPSDEVKRPKMEPIPTSLAT